MTDMLFDFDPPAPASPAPSRFVQLVFGTPVFVVRVYGVPAPQGSKKGFFNPHLNRVQLVDDNKVRLKPWREAVRSEAVAALTLPKALDCPVAVDMVFAFDRPRSHYRTGRNAHLLREGAPVRPVGKPDLDKLARAAGDSLKDAGVLRDDSRISEYRRLVKVWVGEDVDALDRPGALIRVYLIGAPS